MTERSPMLGTPDELERFTWDFVSAMEHEYGEQTEWVRHLLAVAYLRGCRDKQAALRRAGLLAC